MAGADVPAAEAERIAQYIRAEVDAGRRTWGDFLILTRKKTQRLLPYVKALEELQIPMEVSGAGAFAESSEVNDLAHLLRALGDPQDAVSLVGVLRGRLFGISDQQLFQWKQAGGWFSIFADTERDSLKALAVARAIATLAQWYRWTRVLPIAAAIDKILEDSGYLALAATTPAGVEAGDLLHAVDRVRQVAERGGNLSDAAEALDEDLEAIGDVESLPLEPGRTDVVRLMNLHKAKGLEAAVVFLADPLGGARGGVSRRIVRDGVNARGWFVVERPETERQMVPTSARAARGLGRTRRYRSRRFSPRRKRACCTWPPPARETCSSLAARRARGAVVPGRRWIRSCARRPNCRFRRRSVCRSPRA